ncbi:MAG TPA: 30S ribosomal protein S1 [Elusimicrobia bacterium]|nr:MAG: 30S ribosomal protein S1 [Elusimicrobia bacterium GWF2_62_30]HBA59441.1 30S ribosomal protein S1 [Elusimicrobiota bacterium]
MNTNNSHDGTDNEENFETLLAQSYKEPSRMEPGQKVETRIVKLTPEWALIEVGGKGEGYISINEFKDADGKLTAHEGDKIRAWFLRSEEGEMRFTVKIGTGPAARAQLGDAFRGHIPVQGTVSKEMKGGFEITIGGARAFCPFSQMGIRRDEDKAAYIGKSLTFDIIEMSERNVVLSRKGILDVERRAKSASLQETLKEGDRVHGTVTSIQKFGAFVDIGGLEGLLPVSEIAWGRTEKVEDVLKTGQELDLVIKKLDWQNEKISFSLKDALPDPWDSAARNWLPGSYHTGTISRLAPFGAFVTLGEGVDGLIHVSRLSGERRVNHPDEVLKLGETIEVRVEAVDMKNRRISLVPAEISREEEENAATLEKYQNQTDAPALGTMGEMLKKALEKNGKK